MLTTNLTGNFGNHMWYYTICRLVAEAKGYEWGINPNPTHDYFHGSSQFYFLNVDFGKEVVVTGKNAHGLNTYQGIVNEYSDKPKKHNYAGDECLINMFDPNVYDVSDNTMIHLISQSEEYLINRRSEILRWFTIKEEYEKEYDRILSERNISLDDNLCVINFRGGEYNAVPNLIPNKEYWSNSINYIRSINPDMKFIIVTDDALSANYFIPGIETHHIDVGFDFYLVNKCRYSIIAPSSFSWWASWLNTAARLIIAPKYWAKFNISNGYWSLGDSYSKFFKYMSREGFLHDYESCKKEAETFYKTNNLI